MLSGGKTPAFGRDLATAAQDELGGLPGVSGVELAEHDNSVDLTVTLTAEATVDESVAAAEATRRFSEANDTVDRFAAMLVAGEPVSVDPDLPARPAVMIDLYPTVWESPGASVRAALDAFALETVQQVSIVAGWPFVTVEDAADLAPVITELRTWDLFGQGASYSTADLESRVRIVDIPELVSASAITTITALASTYTLGNFWLQSPITGPKAPTLYIDKVTEDEATAIQAALLDPGLAADNSGIRGMPFVISWVGPSGRIDLTGALGAGVVS